MNSYTDWRNTGNFFQYNHYQIYYRYQKHPEANKPTLLLLHGYPTASWDWHKVWDSLGTHYHLITLDYLGYGSSEKPHTFEYHTGKQADICELLLEAQGISNCLVLAHDYGDTVLQELLARQNDQRLPFKIHAAAMLNGGIFIAANRPILIQRLMIGPLGPLIGRLNNRFMFGRNLQRVFAKGHKLTTSELDQIWEMICYNGGRKLLPKLQEYLIERDVNEKRWRGALIDSICPLIFISGELDTISGKHMREYYEQHMPNPKTAKIAVGHYPQLENPHSVVQHALAFYQSLGF